MRNLLLIFSVYFMFSHASIAQGIFESSVVEEAVKPDFKSYLRGVAFGLGDAYFITQAFSELGVQFQQQKGKSMVYADIRFREIYQFGERKTELEAKELYVAYISDNVDFLVGNQVIAWGRTDGFNPTNIISPKNYFFFSPNYDDQNLSNFMIRSKIRINSLMQLDLIGIPVYKPSVYRYDLFEYSENVEFFAMEKPENTFENASFAARFNTEFPSLGFSLSYSNGFHPEYGIELQNYYRDLETKMLIEYLPKPFMHNTFGLDFDITAGDFIFRAEAAYQYTHHYEKYFSEPNPEIAYVAGIEFNLWGFSTIAQYIGKYLFYYTSLEAPTMPDFSDFYEYELYIFNKLNYETEQFNRKIFYQEEEINHAFMVSVNRRFFYELLDADFSFYYNLISESYFFRANAKWQIADALVASIGGNYMYGPPGTLFKLSSPIFNGLYLSLQINL